MCGNGICSSPPCCSMGIGCRTRRPARPLTRQGGHVVSTETSGDLGRLKESVGKHMIRYVGAFAPYLGTKARGSYIYDDTGRAILDFCSGQMCATLGHNHPAVTEAIERS